MSEVNWATIEVLANRAREARERDDPDWRWNWYLFFVGVSVEFMIAHEADEAVMAMCRAFADVAGAFEDASIGAQSPLFQLRPMSNRRPDHSKKRLLKRTIVVLTAAQIRNDCGPNKKREDSFRSVSALLRKKGYDCTWQRIRSIWQNRARDAAVVFGSNEVDLLEAHLQSLGSPPYDSEVISQLADRTIYVFKRAGFKISA